MDRATLKDEPGTLKIIISPQNTTNNQLVLCIMVLRSWTHVFSYSNVTLRSICKVGSVNCMQAALSVALACFSLYRWRDCLLFGFVFEENTNQSILYFCHFQTSVELIKLQKYAVK